MSTLVEKDKLLEEFELSKAKFKELLSKYNDKSNTESVKRKLKAEMIIIRRELERLKDRIDELRKIREEELNTFKPLDQKLLDEWLSVLDS